MKPFKIGIKVLAVLVGLIGIATISWLGFGNRLNDKSGGGIALVAPSFMGVAHAQSPNAAASQITSEAGIAAYTQAQSAITLSQVRPRYRTVELETADYIVGSVAVGDYPESEDVHMYIHKDGWILAYYLSGEPASKVFDWKAFSQNGGITVTTKLAFSIDQVMDSIDNSYAPVTYYDFRNPNATTMMLIGESVNGGCSAKDTFQISLPGTFTYYERSFGVADSGAIYLNDSKLADGDDKSGVYGKIPATQLTLDTLHTVKVNACNSTTVGVIGLIYKEQ